MSSALAPESYHLFGFPIAHSASPALHNYLFARLGLARTYNLCQVTSVSRRMRGLCGAEDFGGASVTMPLKVTVAEMLDRMTDEARAIGAVNTLVPERDNRGDVQLVGTNTDWIGVRNALLHAMFGSTSSPMHGFAFMPACAPALVIGGGGAARAAVYALASVKCAPIYLVGRDASELADVVAQFPHVPCVPISDAAQATNVMLAVGCVPAVSPISPEEHAADSCARAILSKSSAHAPTRFRGRRRVFLDMCYKPRTTPLMAHAANAGWTTVSGIEAMLEQGLAQARMWLTKSVDSGTNTGLIPHDIEEDARTLIRDMPDIVIRPGAERLPEDEVEDTELQVLGRL